MTIKLSKRLSFILKFIPSSADVFYDLCCDHGLLGIAVGQSYNYQEINLVDQVPSIIDKISKQSLPSDIPNAVQINFICQDARNLKLNESYKNIISIAGIGGELAMKMIENLKGHLKETDSLVVSVHNNIHKLREYLIHNNFELIDEGLVEDNKKFYEVLVLKISKLAKSNVTITFSPKVDRSELSEILSYYNQQIIYLKTKIKFNPDTFYEEILKSYSASKSKLN